MIGIVLASHGRLAEGMIDSCRLFFGDDIPQLAAVSLNPGDSPEQFRDLLLEALDKVNEGDGVIVMADLFGGTPCNVATLSLPEDVQLISGMNLPILLELLGLRLGNDTIDIEQLVSVGKDGLRLVDKIKRG